MRGTPAGDVPCTTHTPVSSSEIVTEQSRVLLCSAQREQLRRKMNSDSYNVLPRLVIWPKCMKFLASTSTVQEKDYRHQTPPPLYVADSPTVPLGASKASQCSWKSRVPPSTVPGCLRTYHQANGSVSFPLFGSREHFFFLF